MNCLQEERVNYLEKRDTISSNMQSQGQNFLCIHYSVYKMNTYPLSKTGNTILTDLYLSIVTGPDVLSLKKTVHIFFL